jgi:hypothetical protein
VSTEIGYLEVTAFAFRNEPDEQVAKLLKLPGHRE